MKKRWCLGACGALGGGLLALTLYCSAQPGAATDLSRLPDHPRLLLFKGEEALRR